MHHLRTILRLSLVLGFSHSARAIGPGVLIDYTRLAPPFGVVELPATLVNQLPPPVENLALAWVWVDEHDALKVGLRDARAYRTGRVSVARKLTLDFGDLTSYRESVRENRRLLIGDEALQVLRERHREVGLSSDAGPYDDGRAATTPLVLRELRKRTQLPPDAIDDSVRPRLIELHPDRQIKLSVTGLRQNGESFSAAVMFETLADFNQASGERVTAQEFNRQTLLFWASGDGIDARYVMKTRAEILEQCAELLQFDVRVSPVNYVAPARPEPDSPANGDPTP